MGDKDSKSVQSVHIRLTALENRIDDNSKLLQRLQNQHSHIDTNGSDDASRNSDLNAECFVEFSHFTQSSTCHGWRFVCVPSRQYVRRLLWFLSCLACITTYLYFATHAIVRYNSNPSSTRYELVYKDDLEFPAMTMCHSNKVKRSYIQDSWDNGTFIPKSANVVKDQFKFLKKMILEGKLVLDITGGLNNTITPVGLDFYLRSSGLLENITAEMTKQNLVSNESVEDFVVQLINTAELHVDLRDNLNYMDMDILCEFLQSENISCHNVYRDWLTYDLETVFRGGHSFTDLLPPSAAKGGTVLCAQLHVNYWSPVPLRCEYSSFLDTTMGLCHTVRFYMVNSGQPVTASRKNKINAVNVGIQTMLSEFVPVWNFVNNAHLFLQFHEAGHFVEMAEPDQVIETGRIYDIILEKSVRTNLPPPFTTCLDKDDESFTNTLKYYNYSYNSCMKECTNDAMIAECGCRDIGIPNDERPPCTVAEMRECPPAQGEVECPHCRRPCTEVKYSSTQNALGTANDTNDIVLYISFKELAYSHIRQVAAYPAESLFGDLGGNLGLFMGASLLSVMELVDLGVVGVWKRVKRGWKGLGHAERNAVEPGINGCELGCVTVEPVAVE